MVHDAVKAFIASEGELTDRVMAAMDAADAKGGDSQEMKRYLAILTVKIGIASLADAPPAFPPA